MPAKVRQRKKSSSPSEKDTALHGVNPAASDHTDPEHSPEFEIVCIGGSAGGIEAVTDLLSGLAPDTGMAFVIVQHLDPTHSSMLAEILDKDTPMPVCTAADGMQVEPNHVYVIPPGKDMVIGDGVLQLSPRTQPRGIHRPIDHFLRSLAEEHGFKSIGVILSGMGSDGSLGIEEIKAAGGITFAQDRSADQTSMPTHAIATGCIDMVMSPAEIARELNRIPQHPLMHPPTQAQDTSHRAFERIIDTIRNVVGVDFANYKRNTLHRRITRRMVLHKFEDLDKYAAFVSEHTSEAEALYQDILINVTSFFRDPEAYDELQGKLFPDLTANRARSEPIRVWALGCSTGEEAYSIAMAYSEFAERAGVSTPMQIFATDLNGIGIEKARAGIYAKGISQDVSPERLRRFFIDIDGSYRICKPIRDMCVFARQNVLSDPPFSRLDIVACRNVLIYLEPVLQQRLIPMLHYALRNKGYLWLGMSETIGSYRDLFEAQDLKYKFYIRRPGAAGSPALMLERPSLAMQRLQSKISLPMPDTKIADQNREADRILLARYAPPSVVLTRDLEIIQFRGDTSPYLTPAPGKASLNLLKMLREGLAASVRRTAQAALRDQVTMREENLRVRFEGGFRDITIEAIPIKAARGNEALLLLFQDKNAPAFREPSISVPNASPDDAEREIAQLRQELADTREYLQSVIEQQEAMNEELQSANEEVQSTNEELQSINEELETSKEEIQSSNEELTTVNDELQARNIELTRSNNDLLNVLGSAHLPIVILGRDLRIRRITPAAEAVLNLIPGDIGRPLNDIKLATPIPDLEELLLEVLDDITVREVKVQDRKGCWFLVRVRPYRTLENQIDGVVLMFIDIDALQRSEAALAESEGRFAQLANSAPVLIWVSSGERVLYANDSMVDFLGTNPIGQDFDWTGFVHPLDRDNFRETYRRSKEGREPFNMQARFRRRDGQYRWLKIIAQPRMSGADFLGYVGCAFDIGDLKDAEAALREADTSKNRFLAIVGHELRNPLAAVHNSIQVLKLGKPDSSTFQTALDIIDRQSRNMVRMIDDLLDISRIQHGMVRLQIERIDLLQTIHRVIAATEHDRRRANQHIKLIQPEQPIWVEADPVRMEQIFSNLLVNASKFTLEGGHVTVNVALDAGAPVIMGNGGGSAAAAQPIVTVCIIDDGVGLSPQMVEQVFGLFVQAETERSRASLGLGLGLPLTRQLVELHGGTIRATSEGVGRGVQFEVRLPTVAANAEDRIEKTPKLPESRGDKVLIVDDNADAADVMKIILELADYRTQIAYDGKQAIDCAQAYHPDIVLLDIYLPDTTGWELAPRIRKECGLGQALIVAVTGIDSPADRKRSAEAGIDRHLTKPVDMALLWKYINEWKQEQQAAAAQAAATPEQTAAP